MEEYKDIDWYYKGLWCLLTPHNYTVYDVTAITRQLTPVLYGTNKTKKEIETRIDEVLKPNYYYNTDCQYYIKSIMSGRCVFSRNCSQNCMFANDGCDLSQDDYDELQDTFKDLENTYDDLNDYIQQVKGIIELVEN